MFRKYKKLSKSDLKMAIIQAFKPYLAKPAK